MPFYVIPPLLSCVFLSALGLFVLTRNQKSIINISCAVGTFSAALMECAYFFLLLTKSFLWTRIALFGVCGLPISLAVLSLTFARQNYRESLSQWKWALGGIGGLSLWFLYLGFSGALVTKTTHLSFGRFEIYTVQPAGSYFFVFLLLSILFVLHNFENTYRNASTETRWKIKYFIVGIFSAAFFYIFLISFMLLYKIVRVEYFVAEAVILIIAGLLIAFSLVRHRLMDTDVFISRQVVYNSFVLFVAGAYLITIAVIGYLVKYRFIHQDVTQFLVAEIFMYVAIIGMALLLLSENIRHRVELYISKHFYKHKYEYDEVWIALTRRIGSNIHLDSLLPELMNSMQEIVNTERVFIFLRDTQSNQFVLRAASPRPEKTYSISMNSELVSYFRRTETPQADVAIFKTEEQFQALYTEQKDLFEALGIALCVPLRVKDNFLGILAIGQERTGEPYSHEDYDLLHTIGLQAASVILNAQLTENLSQARALETFHKFSAFILHDLKNSVQNLSFVVQNAPDYFDEPEFRDDAIKTISDTVKRMNDMITKFSSVPEKLEIYRTNIPIRSFLDDTLKKSKVSKLDHIAIQISLPEPTLTISLDAHHFQSVLLNLLSNAAESITRETGEIEIRVARFDQSAEIAVRDNGCGMSSEQLKTLFTPFKSTKKKGLGIGLYQSKTIVEAHGGTISVESQEGQGTVFRLELPLTDQEESTD